MIDDTNREINAPQVDVLMITYNRPHYTSLALDQLLATCTSYTRVWLWHNGDDQATLDIVKSRLGHPAVHKFHHSVENQKLREPTNWFYTNSTGDYLSKVDDDCLMPNGWIETLTQVHRLNEDVGVLGCWRFMPEDFVPELANKKIQTLNGGSQIMRNCWVEGSGYLMKRNCVRQAGIIGPKESFPKYCIRLARMGFKNGWYYPFLFQEHMDDPRAEHSLLKSDADLQQHLPLSAVKFGSVTLDEWQNQLKRSARTVQEAPFNPSAFAPWKVFLRNRLRRLAKKFGREYVSW